jgi:hypothetical protein
MITAFNLLLDFDRPLAIAGDGESPDHARPSSTDHFHFSREEGTIGGTNSSSKSRYDPTNWGLDRQYRPQITSIGSGRFPQPVEGIDERRGPDDFPTSESRRGHRATMSPSSGHPGVDPKRIRSGGQNGPSSSRAGHPTRLAIDTEVDKILVITITPGAPMPEKPGLVDSASIKIDELMMYQAHAVASQATPRRRHHFRRSCPTRACPLPPASTRPRRFWGST